MLIKANLNFYLLFLLEQPKKGLIKTALMFKTVFINPLPF